MFWHQLQSIAQSILLNFQRLIGKIRNRLNLIKKNYSKLNSAPADEKRLYINVPYSEKDKAKELGAKWDPIKKSWFIPKGLNQINFEKWLPKNNDKNIESTIRSVGFHIAESLESCWTV